MLAGVKTASLSMPDAFPADVRIDGPAHIDLAPLAAGNHSPILNARSLGDDKFDLAPFRIKVFRPADCLEITVKIVRMSLKGDMLVKYEGPAFIILELPPQHLEEAAIWTDELNLDLNPDPSLAQFKSLLEAILAQIPNKGTARRSMSRLSGPSRICFRVPDKVKSVPFSLFGILDFCSKCSPNVAAAALDANRPVISQPVAPEPLETSIEFPLGLYISPSEKVLWDCRSKISPAHHSWTQIWQMSPQTSDSYIRAIWSSDYAHQSNPDWDMTSAATKFVSRRPLTSEDRIQLVDQTSRDTVLGVAQPQLSQPFTAHLLELTSVGANVDFAGKFDVRNEKKGDQMATISTLVDYEERARVGRDNYVKVAYAGYIFPLWMAAVLVFESRRRTVPIQVTGGGHFYVTYLEKHAYIKLLETSRDFTIIDTSSGSEVYTSDMPFHKVEVRMVAPPTNGSDDAKALKAWKSKDLDLAPGDLIISALNQKQIGALWIRHGGQLDRMPVTLTDVRGNHQATDFGLAWISADAKFLDGSKDEDIVNPTITVQNAYLASKDASSSSFGAQLVGYAPVPDGADTCRTEFPTSEIQWAFNRSKVYLKYYGEPADQSTYQKDVVPRLMLGTSGVRLVDAEGTLLPAADTIDLSADALKLPQSLATGLGQFKSDLRQLFSGQNQQYQDPTLTINLNLPVSPFGSNPVGTNIVDLENWLAVIADKVNDDVQTLQNGYDVAIAKWRGLTKAFDEATRNQISQQSFYSQLTPDALKYLFQSYNNFISRMALAESRLEVQYQKAFARVDNLLSSFESQYVRTLKSYTNTAQGIHDRLDHLVKDLQVGDGGQGLTQKVNELQDRLKLLKSRDATQWQTLTTELQNYLKAQDPTNNIRTKLLDASTALKGRAGELITAVKDVQAKVSAQENALPTYVNAVAADVDSLYTAIDQDFLTEITRLNGVIASLKAIFGDLNKAAGIFGVSFDQNEDAITKAVSEFWQTGGTEIDDALWNAANGLLDSIQKSIKDTTQDHVTSQVSAGLALVAKMVTDYIAQALGEVQQAVKNLGIFGKVLALVLNPMIGKIEAALDLDQPLGQTPTAIQKRLTLIFNSTLQNAETKLLNDIRNALETLQSDCAASANAADIDKAFNNALKSLGGSVATIKGDVSSLFTAVDKLKLALEATASDIGVIKLRARFAVFEQHVTMLAISVALNNIQNPVSALEKEIQADIAAVQAAIDRILKGDGESIGILGYVAFLQSEATTIRNQAEGYVDAELNEATLTLANLEDMARTGAESVAGQLVSAAKGEAAKITAAIQKEFTPVVAQLLNIPYVGDLASPQAVEAAFNQVRQEVDKAQREIERQAKAAVGAEFDAVKIKLNQAFQQSGFVNNTRKVFADLVNELPSKFDAAKIGGMLAPDVAINCLSAVNGPVRDIVNQLNVPTLDPKDLFAQAKILGGIYLKDVLGNLVGKNLPNVKRTPNGIEYRYTLVQEKTQENPPKYEPFVKTDIFLPQNGTQGTDIDDGPPTKLRVDISASLGAGGSVTSEIVLENFTVFLWAIMVKFNSAEFHTRNSHLTINPDIEKVEFCGPLEFVNDLQSLISFTGDNFYTKLDGTTFAAGIFFSFPSITCGVMSITGLGLGAELDLSLFGDPIRVKFLFANPAKPAAITVSILSGGIGISASMLSDVARRLEGFEGVIEYGGGLFFSIAGILSGSIEAKIGIYYKIGLHQLDLGSYVRLEGRVSILGIITADVLFLVGLYYIQGELFGKAIYSVSVRIGFFSFSKSFEVEKHIAGSKANTDDPQALDMQSLFAEALDDDSVQEALLTRPQPARSALAPSWSRYPVPMTTAKTWRQAMPKRDFDNYVNHLVPEAKRSALR